MKIFGKLFIILRFQNCINQPVGLHKNIAGQERMSCPATVKVNDISCYTR